jgi:anti-anti-sigma regulatory factor
VPTPNVPTPNGAVVTGPDAALHVTRWSDHGVTVAVPVGVLDLATYPLMRDALLKYATDLPRAVVVDLDAVRADRTSALAVFPAVWMRLGQWPGIPLLLAATSEPLASMLRTSAVPRFVATHATVTEAVATVGAGPARRYAAVALTGEPGDSAPARAWLTELGRRWGLGPIADAVLVLSELVENMTRHTIGPGHLRVELRGTSLSVAVSDGDPTPPRLVAPGAATLQGGRGIAVVDAIARIWGHNPCTTGGKVVWAVVPLDDPRRGSPAGGRPPPLNPSGPHPPRNGAESPITHDPLPSQRRNPTGSRRSISSS